MQAKIDGFVNRSIGYVENATSIIMHSSGQRLLQLIFDDGSKSSQVTGSPYLLANSCHGTMTPRFDCLSELHKPTPATSMLACYGRTQSYPRDGNSTLSLSKARRLHTPWVRNKGPGRTFDLRDREGEEEGREENRKGRRTRCLHVIIVPNVCSTRLCLSTLFARLLWHEFLPQTWWSINAYKKHQKAATSIKHFPLQNMAQFRSALFPT